MLFDLPIRCSRVRVCYQANHIVVSGLSPFITSGPVLRRPSVIYQHLVVFIVCVATVPDRVPKPHWCLCRRPTGQTVRHKRSPWETEHMPGLHGRPCV